MLAGCYKIICLGFKMTKKNCTIIVPTFNGGALWKEAARRLVEEKFNFPNIINEIIVIDSSSADDTVTIAHVNNFKVVEINSSEFNHGGTRNLCMDLLNDDVDIVCFLTQDALVEKNAIENIVNSFDTDNVAVVYGRQLPHEDANPLAQHARNFNYKAESYISNLSKKNDLGIKAVYTSNSFCAYNLKIFKLLNGFPINTILSEDMFFASKALLAGYDIKYESSAIVKHSHNYTAVQEFKRYFDIGVFHSMESWIRKSFGGAGSEGKRFLISEFKFVIKNNISFLPKSLANNFAKIVGYKLGQNYTKIPKSFIKKMSMHSRYWK